MAIKLQIRRGTAANWTSSDPTLLEGEIGYELDTGNWKVGDGTTSWQTLPYQFPYLKGSKALDKETLCVDQTNDRVGIGTETPLAVLHIEDAAPIIRMRDTDSGAGIYSEIGTSNTDGTIVISADAGNASGTSNASKIQFVIDNAATPQVTVLSDRKVGIGTASPASSIHVVSSTTTADINLVNSGTTGGTGGLSISTSSNAASITNVENSTLTFGTNNADRVTISAGGNVGIGTTSPSTLVHVSGTAPVMRISDTSSTSNAGYVEFDCDNNDGSVAIKADPTAAGISTSNVRIDVDGTQVARFIHAASNTPRLSVGSETAPTGNVHIRADAPKIRVIDTANTNHVHDFNFAGPASSIEIHANVNSASTGVGQSSVNLSTKGVVRFEARDDEIRCNEPVNLLDGAVVTGNFDVTGNLTVTGTSSFTGAPTHASDPANPNALCRKSYVDNLSRIGAQHFVVVRNSTIQNQTVSTYFTIASGEIRVNSGVGTGTWYAQWITNDNSGEQANTVTTSSGFPIPGSWGSASFTVVLTRTA